jgi:hypothetical protein
MKATKADKLIILMLFALTLLSFNVRSYFGAAGKEAHVFLDGKLKYTISLDHEKEYKIRVLNGEATIEVFDGKLYIMEAPCPLKICIKDSPISREGEALVCVPNNMIVKVAGSKEEEVLDTVTK